MKYFLTIDNIYIIDEGDGPKMSQEYNSILSEGDLAQRYLLLQIDVKLITITPAGGGLQEVIPNNGMLTECQAVFIFIAWRRVLSVRRKNSCCSNDAIVFVGIKNFD